MDETERYYENRIETEHNSNYCFQEIKKLLSSKYRLGKINSTDVITKKRAIIEYKKTDKDLDNNWGTAGWLSWVQQFTTSGVAIIGARILMHTPQGKELAEILEKLDMQKLLSN